MSDGDKIPYLKVNKLLWRWTRYEGAEGCTVVREARLSMDKGPPCLPKPPEPKLTPSRSTPKPRPPEPLVKFLDDIEKMSGGFSRFKSWLNTREPPKELQLVPRPKQKIEQIVPPFDIQEIPGAMRKEFMPVSAKLMERWFAGELNYGPTDKDVAAEINQKGEHYPPDMYDTTTIKLDWVLKYRRAKDQYDELITTQIRTSRARQALKEILLPYAARPCLDARTECGENLSKLHRQFQFQYVKVGSSLSQKIGELLYADFHNNGVPDDLTGALGSFGIYAAVGYAEFYREGNTRVAEISGIYVYIKDSYDFTDKPGEASQYLGHWSKNGVIVLAYNGAMSYLNEPRLYFSYPVALGNPKVRGNVYYPVHNKDFREWAIRHQRGGDFVIYSDRKLVRIDPPIKVYL
ncbi:hypothetical protein F6X37_13110 [Paraburkholderia sp. 31.1]|uniref:DUF6402 family protein n=1 Tax=Paraburkholderia sp. 31.1 TaxID=2615205 RepID=UPI001654F758|nr:DUF6402 family protein [Paraburkholderia sp. 31.1]MBC8722507.1 hypothetical protein [Paraburkholderia sp. 31.1]